MMRLLNISLRTAHIASMGVLLGGHAFDVVPERLEAILWMTIGTGILLAGLESEGRLLWFHQVRGFMTLVKLALICMVPFAWEHRLSVLLGVVAIASVASHMPGRFRHYSVVYRRVIRE